MKTLVSLCSLLLSFLITGCAHQPIFFTGFHNTSLQPTTLTSAQPSKPVLSKNQTLAEPPIVLVAASPTPEIKEKSRETAASAQLLRPVKALLNQNPIQKIVTEKLPPPIPAKGYKPNRRNKTVATILAIPFLFGMLGLHRFYLGYYLIGILQLGLTAVGVFLGPAPILILTFCWIVTDFVRILKEVLEPKDGRYS